MNPEAIEALLAAGWQLVPPNPTREMINAIADELYPPHLVMPSKYPQYLDALGVKFKLPIVDWSEADVLDYLGALINPLYLPPFNRGRVGCNPCLAAGDEAKEQAFYQDDFGRSQLIATDAIAQIIKKPIWSSKGGLARNQLGCGVCSI